VTSSAIVVSTSATYYESNARGLDKIKYIGIKYISLLITQVKLFKYVTNREFTRNINKITLLQLSYISYILSQL